MTHSSTIAPPEAAPAPSTRPPRARRRPGADTGRRALPPRWAVSLVSLAVAVGAWAAVAAWIDDPIVPSPAEVFSRVAAITVSGDAAANFASSIGKIAAGFALAMVGGLLVGFSMAEADS